MFLLIIFITCNVYINRCSLLIDEDILEKYIAFIDFSDKLRYINNGHAAIFISRFNFSKLSYRIPFIVENEVYIGTDDVMFIFFEESTRAHLLKYQSEPCVLPLEMVIQCFTG